jgi:hypothetical protein
MVPCGEHGLRNTKALTDGSYNGSRRFRIAQSHWGIRVAGDLAGNVLVGQGILRGPVRLVDGLL